MAFDRKRNGSIGFGHTKPGITAHPAYRQTKGKALIASETRFRRLFESAQDGILILDGKTGKIIEVNPFLIHLLEFSESELMGKELWEIGFFADQKKSRAAFVQLRRTGYLRYEDLPLKTKSGKTREVEFVCNSYESGSETVFQCNIRDISKRKADEVVLEAANEVLRNTVHELGERNKEIGLLSEMGDCLHTCVSLDEAYRVVARFSGQLFPQTEGVLYTVKEAQNVVAVAIQWGGEGSGDQEFAPNDCVSLRRGRVHMINGEGSSTSLTCRHMNPEAENYLCAPMIAYGEIQGILHLRKKSGEAERSGAPPIPFEKSQLGLAGAIADYIGLALANLKLRETLRQQSIHDPVTSLYNRRYMQEAMERELRRSLREQRPLGFLMFDIDHFKGLNDSFGHDAGDAVLAALGNFLQMQIRGNDIPFRYGGEEFLIILPRIPLSECQKRAEKLREGVKNLEIKYEGKPLPRITFSVGVAGFPEHGDTLEAILKAADTALYSAKAAGRDQVVTGPPTPAFNMDNNKMVKAN